MINASQFTSQLNSIVSHLLDTSTAAPRASVAKNQHNDCIKEAIHRITEAFFSMKDCIAALFGCERTSRPKTPLDILVEKGKGIIQTHVNNSTLQGMKEREIKAATVLSFDNQILGFHCGKIDNAFRSSIGNFAKRAGDELQRSLIGHLINPTSRLTVTTIYLENPRSAAQDNTVKLQYHTTHLKNDDTNEQQSTVGTRDTIVMGAARSAIDHLLRESHADPKNCKQELARFFFEQR